MAILKSLIIQWQQQCVWHLQAHDKQLQV